MNGLRSRVDAARSSPEGQRSLWSGVGLVGSSVCMAAFVFIAARELGTENYGVYAGIGALVNLASMFGGLGTKEVLLQRVTRDRDELPAAYGVMVVASLGVGVVLVAATIVVAALLLPDRDLKAIAFIAIAEYMSTVLLKGPGAVWVAIDRFSRVAGVNIADAILRLSAALALVLGVVEGVSGLAAALVVLMTAGAIVVNLHVLRATGRPTVARRELIEGCRVGAPFSVAAVSSAVNNNIDQFMLLRAKLDVDAGLYAAGVRFIAYSLLPLHARVSASVPEFFRLGADGPRAGLRYGRKLAPQLIGISLAGSVVAIIFTKPLAALLGDKFDGVLPVVVALAGFPVVRAVQTVLDRALMGSGHQQFVARVQIITAVLNIAMNLVLIPRYGWRGAVVATYLSELINLTMLWLGARKRIDTPGASTVSVRK